MGLIIAPLFPVSERKFERLYELEVRRPDESIFECTARFEIPFQTPPPKVRCYCCILQDVNKADVPIGSTLWLKRSK